MYISPFIRIRYIKTITINTHIDCFNNSKCSVRDILLATKQGAFESVLSTFSVNISMSMTNVLKQANGDYKKFLYARASHSNHVIQYHMHQIMEKQKVVNKYKSMMVDRMDLTPMELNLYKSDPVVISHIIHMIEVDNFWQQKTFRQS